MVKDKISFAEWSFISLFCGAMLGVCIASLPPSTTTTSIHSRSAVDVYISGEVEKPGPYQLPAGSTIQDALVCAGLKNSAGALKIKNSARLRQGQTIKVPKKRKKKEKRNSFVVEKSAV